ncbi:MAG: acyl-CoA/acyl-ACP dehydrogenase [Myxococcales bacterium]|nr:acyl-CoA/acyl-ACP dehydrogenase [Myxococcales bacterium]
MDFQLSEDQESLQAGVRSFCDGHFPVETLRELEYRGYDAALWAELAELGVFNLRLAEAEGGIGLGTADAVIVFAELGRRLVPGPLVWTHLAAELVPGAGDGKTVVGGLDLCGAEREPLLVEHLADLDRLIVLRPDSVSCVDASALNAEPIEVPLDPLTPVHHLAELPEGESLGGTELAERLRLAGCTLASAQLLGLAEASHELAVEYAKGRKQFGRAIGSFQAVKHILADMFVRLEVARAAVYAAGATLDDPGVGDAARAAGSAKLVAGEAALQNARACIQVHGGMGYTWEVPVHYYLKRSWVLASVFGGAEEHAEALARCVELDARAPGTSL